MAELKSYFTVDNLVKLCKKLKLKTDGTKTDLIEELNNYEPPAEISHVSVFRARVTDVPERDINEQSVGHIHGVRKRFGRNSLLLVGAVFIGFVAGFFSYELFSGVEHIQIPVKRSLFPW